MYWNNRKWDNLTELFDSLSVKLINVNYKYGHCKILENYVN